MASFKIEWKTSAGKELRKLDRDIILKILDIVGQLIDDPYPGGCRKLKGSQQTYRIRTGDYRIVYTVKSELLIIEIIRVGHRKDIYKRLT